ncbi:hypothetical protein SBX64_10670 [Vibrio rhizosphaerae]|uniref:Phage protein n=1 Tax=Vibrio rhizosphaerae TaxID=398736 RepID=A0ABU4IV83_9VIBR|nr:hypothetical protein [Vibrio rhizosphaerae]MDW6093013.1 hypothetical protein [Vibrio rhizosphaerae]
MFYKMYSESLDGDEGEFFCEVVDGLVVKQLHIYGENMYWATENSCNDPLYDFTDQPEFDPELIDCEEISSSEFLSMWNEALRG